MIVVKRSRPFVRCMLTRWEGTELYGYSPLIYAFEVHDVAITGKGVIDGNAESEFLTWPGELQEDDQLALRQMGNDGTPADERIFGEGTHLRPPIIQFFRADAVVVKSGRDRDGREIGRPSENVVVRHNDKGGEDGIGRQALHRAARHRLVARTRRVESRSTPSIYYRFMFLHHPNIRTPPGHVAGGDTPGRSG